MITVDSTSIDLSHLNGKALEKYFHTFTGLDLSNTHKKSFAGSETGSDILLFVIETMPNAIVDFTKNTKNLPGISKLADNAFISSKHFTTYPYTTNAIFSLLSSCYPIRIHQDYLNSINQFNQFGLMSILAENAYHTSVYSPIANGYFADLPLYQLLGSEKVYLAPEKYFLPDQVEKKVQDFTKTLPVFKTSPEKQLKKIHDKLFFDLMAFEKLKADITGWKMSDERFIALFFPVLSHGPWPDLYDRKNIDDAGHDLALIQLKWLDDLVVFLEQKHWLQNTIVLVTSDHGVRTAEEYKTLPPGMINMYSFNVPLLIYLPNTLNSKILLENMTSHIDIMPTILNLLNVPRNSYYAQGIPIWDDSKRDLFFLADDFFGADAYFSQPDYFMHQSVDEVSLQSKDINFDYTQDTLILKDEKVKDSTFWVDFS